MAAHLVGLKWRLFRNGLRGDRQRRVGLPLLVVVLAGAGWWAASSFYRSAASLSEGAAAEYTLWVVTIGWLVWVVTPVVFFPLDEPLDPVKLGLLPLSRAQLMSGLAASGLISATIVVPLAVLAADVSLFVAPESFVVVVAASCVLMLLLVVGGQTFTSVASLALRHRRGRDLAFLFVAGVGLGIYVVYQTFSTTVEAAGLEGAVTTYRLSPWSWLIPPAAAQHAIVAAAGNHLAHALGSLLVAFVWLALLSVLWNKLIDRLVTTPGPPSLSYRRERKRRTAVVVRKPAAAVVRKEMLVYLRDPRLRMVWTGGAVFVALLVASLLVGTTRLEAFRHLPWLTMAGPVVVLLIGLPVTLNQIGWERNAASFLFSLPLPPRALLTGKSLSAGGVLLAEGIIMSVVLAAVSDGWEWLPFAIPIALTAIGCQLAIGNIVSVLAPLRLPPLGTDLFAQATEQGCLSIISQGLAFFVIGVLLMPTAVAFIVVAAGYLDPFVVSAGSMLWGALVYWLGLRCSAWLLRRRVPELVGAVETRV